MLINRITSVVAAILVVVTCLLVTNSLGFAFNSANQHSKHLMHHNSNNGHLLALTSTGVRQAKSDMAQPKSTSQSTRDRRQAGQRTNMLHVIYGLASHFEKVQTESAGAFNELPVARLAVAFKHKSRSSHSIESKLAKHFAPLVDGNWKANHLSAQFSTVVLPSQVQETAKVFALASRNSQNRSKRDLNLGEQMNYISQRVTLHNLCSRNFVNLDDGRINAAPSSKGNHTQFILIEAKPNATAIFSPQVKKFLCFDPSTGKVVPKDCFDYCLCAIHENIAHNHHEFLSVSNPKWKIGFNKKGMPFSFAKVIKKGQQRCFRFVKSIESQMESEHAGVTEEKSCLKGNIWEQTGMRLFEKEIAAHPSYKCILSHHSEVVSQSLSLNSTKEHKRSLIEEYAFIAAQAQSLSSKTNNGTWAVRSALPANRNKANKSPPLNRCMKRLSRKRKVRHRNNKKRSSC